jgi:SAM-dependent methyltransferase
VSGERIDFLCNVCGRRNPGTPLHVVQDREGQSCAFCHSSLRMRSLVHALAAALFGSPRVLPAFPSDKSIRGLGMSDWEGYAQLLAQRLDYVNTFYHAEPRLDIANVPAELLGRHDFLISSDVFEHIPPRDLDRAFENSRRLLRPGGAFIFTVPFVKEGETVEHFPRLNDFHIVEEGGRRVLRNRTVDGEEETFDQLVFHGGEGMTLEMRMFSQPDLLRRLERAGFSSAAVRIDHAPQFGIMWPIDYAVPIVARA